MVAQPSRRGHRFSTRSGRPQGLPRANLLWWGVGAVKAFLLDASYQKRSSGCMAKTL